jgi:hypothetical protein
VTRLDPDARAKAAWKTSEKKSRGGEERNAAGVSQISIAQVCYVKDAADLRAFAAEHRYNNTGEQEKTRLTLHLRIG